MPELPIILVIAGCVALLVGLFGGGVKAKELEIPKIDRLPRIFSSLVGLILIAVATWLYIQKLGEPSNPTGQPTAITNTGAPSSSPYVPPSPKVTITLTNNNCSAQDYYVDGIKFISAIPAGAIESFQSTAGRHATYVCQPGTNACASPQQTDWTTNQIVTIGRSRSCPVTITLTNNNCESQDYYVDGRMVLSAIPSGATRNFQSTAGQHSTYVCQPGTNACASPQQTDWTSKRTVTIGRASYCR